MVSELLDVIKLLFIIAIIAGCFYLVYYFKVIKEGSQKTLLEICLSIAERNYIVDRNNACRVLGEKEKCDLPAFFSGPIEKRYQNEKDDCFRRYPQGQFK